MSITYCFYPIARNTATNSWEYVGWHKRNGDAVEIAWGKSIFGGVIGELACHDSIGFYGDDLLKTILNHKDDAEFDPDNYISGLYCINLQGMDLSADAEDKIVWVHRNILNMEDRDLSDYIFDEDEVTHEKYILTTEMYASLRGSSKEKYAPRIYKDFDSAKYILTKRVILPLEAWIRSVRWTKGYKDIDWDTLRLLITAS